MHEPQHFTVQPCSHEHGEPCFSGCIHVEALSPVDAAERALREQLSLSGPAGRLRARVWRLGVDYQPISVLLYRA